MKRAVAYVARTAPAQAETGLYCPVEQPPSDFLYVSIGSGVSILEVRDCSGGTEARGLPTRYRRIADG